MATIQADRRAPTRVRVTSLPRNLASPWRHVDAVLLVAVLAVAALGCLMVFSSTRGRDPSSYDTTFLQRQALFVVVGVIVMAAVTLLDYRRLKELGPLFYVAVLGLLVAVVSGAGSERKGAQSWFELGPFQLQPSELAKVAVIVALAAVLVRSDQELRFLRLLAVLAVTGLPVALIMLQPDLGTALVFIAIVMGMLLVGGVKMRYMVGFALIGVIGAWTMLGSGALEEYQRCRLTSFLDRQDEACEERDAAFNQDQSMVAVGSGGFIGKGPFQGTQTRLDIVPEQHTDFIFTAVGEELGFIGSTTLLALLSVIAWRILRTAQLARDHFGTLICVGVLSMFVFQVFQNIGMAMGIMPVTGIPLPFMSYGGSSTIAGFLAVGLVLSIHMRRFN
jgi:rod shape determining protein RodA